MSTTVKSQPTPRNIYSPRVRVVSPKGKEPAQQQFKEDCDVNTIMARYQKTGIIDHVQQHQAEYGFASPLDYHTSMNVITRADSMFADLPSSIRDEFRNSAAAFLEFVQDPKNADRAKELGIALSPEAAVQAAELQAEAKPDESAPDTAPDGQSGGSGESQ